MTTNPRTPDSVATLETTFGILDGLQDLEGARISELAQHLGIAKSTVHRHLHTLDENGYVVCVDGVYYVALKFLEIGGNAKNRNSVWEQVRPVISTLAQRTGERALFAVEEHGRAYFVHRETGENAVPSSRQSLRSYPLHSIAAGKAIMAQMPEGQAEELLNRYDLSSLTHRTVTDKDELLEEIAQIRERGVAFNDGESLEGLRAVAVPVMGKDRQVHGAISISGSDRRLTGDYFEQELPNLLFRTINELELSIELP